MLQVTFKDLLPSEPLLAIAKRAYARLREQDGPSGESVCWHITIGNERAAGECIDRYRVRVELVRARRTELSTSTEGVDPQRALRAGMNVAAGMMRIAAGLHQPASLAMKPIALATV